MDPLWGFRERLEEQSLYPLWKQNTVSALWIPGGDSDARIIGKEMTVSPTYLVELDQGHLVTLTSAYCSDYEVTSCLCLGTPD